MFTPVFQTLAVCQTPLIRHPQSYLHFFHLTFGIVVLLFGWHWLAPFQQPAYAAFQCMAVCSCQLSKEEFRKDGLWIQRLFRFILTFRNVCAVMRWPAAVCRLHQLFFWGTSRYEYSTLSHRIELVLVYVFNFLMIIFSDAKRAALYAINLVPLMSWITVWESLVEVGKRDGP